MSKENQIVIKNSRENNLKNVSLSIPRNTFSVITGISGSGKSSLAYGTLFKEGQRRYLASLPSYARQFMEQMSRPDVDDIEGLSPTISIDQKTSGFNSRSTVGTITETYDFMRLLFARLGVVACPNGHGLITQQTPQSIADRIYLEHIGGKVYVMSPVVMDRKGEYRKELQEFKEQGFRRIRINGEILKLDDPITLDRYKKHTLELVIDYLTLNEENRQRFYDSILQATTKTGGLVSFEVVKEESSKPLYSLFSMSNSCPVCGYSFGEMEPRMFSFNAVQGMCPTCLGLGHRLELDANKMIANRDKAIFDGGLHLLNAEGNVVFCARGRKEINLIAKKWKLDLKEPIGKLPKEFIERIVLGAFSKDRDGVDFSMMSELSGSIEGDSHYFSPYVSEKDCEVCLGSRLSERTKYVLFRDKAISDYAKMSVKEMHEVFTNLKLSKGEEEIGKPILYEIVERLRFLNGVGLEYLTIGRRANTLSGGESQRIRLAAQIGSGLEGCLYILDEPSIGLHQSDNRKLIKTLKMLRDKSNTVFVIEHDEDTILSADHLVDVGPLAGTEGGEIVYNDSPRHFLHHQDVWKRSMTVAYMCGQRQINRRRKKKIDLKKKITLKGVKKFNLQGVDVFIPLGVFNVVVGVSGSGKSTLVNDVLTRAFAGNAGNDLEDFQIQGDVKKLVEIDQKPIGRTPRSNLSTYTKAMDVIRDLFVRVPESRARGYKVGRFSFNVSGGRCEHCFGAGVLEIETQLFASNEVVCDHCGGKRFNDTTLQIHYKKKNIFDVLEMSVDEAFDFFEDVPKLKRIFSVLKEIGLGYLRLGQPSTTLSGGEAQRIKLASELSKTNRQPTLYVLDEPTTGLHLYDIEKLVASFYRLVDQGHTLVVIEHNLDVVKCADFIIEMGPKGGDEGGRLIFSGSVEQLSKAETLTAKELRDYLKRDELRKKGEYLKEEGFQKLFEAVDSEELEKKPVSNAIVVKNLTKHNLQGVDLNLPKNQMIVFTGLSGSGKSSIAFDTLFKEGQRKYVESLSTYARRFLGRIPRPEADLVEGISPTIAIDQKRQGRNPRSTIATQTEIYDGLRVIYANASKPHCPACHKPLLVYSADDLTKDLIKNHLGEGFTIYAPLFEKKNLEQYLIRDYNNIPKFLDIFSEKGYLRVQIDEKIEKIEELQKIDWDKVERVGLVIDRLSISEDGRSRLIEAVDQSYEISEGYAFFYGENGVLTYGERPFCFEHSVFFEKEYAPRDFSFNYHSGYCKDCHGLGVGSYVDLDLMIVNKKLPLTKGALHKSISNRMTNAHMIEGYYLRRASKIIGIDLSKKPVETYSEEEMNYIFYGAKSAGYDFNWEGMIKRVENMILLGRLTEAETSAFIKIGACKTCCGERLNERLRHLWIDQKNISALCAMNVSNLSSWFSRLQDKLSKTQYQMLKEIIAELQKKLVSLDELGLSYLTLDRTMSSVSGGESQRIRLATQIGNKLKDVIYVLDEPTIGLHDKDTEKLVKLLKDLKDGGNTALVVEHDELVIKSADWVVDVGPKAGRLGGKIIYSGDAKRVPKETSFYPYLYGEKKDPVLLQNMKKEDRGFIEIKNLSRNNLKNVELRFPVGEFVCLSGVSGAGKSSLLEELAERLEKTLHKKQKVDDMICTKKGAFPFIQFFYIDQSPIQKSSRSTLASYMDFFDVIRKLFSQTTMAKERGYGISEFSYNSSKGACPRCGGLGFEKVEMHFMADVEILCNECEGRRYQSFILEVKRNGKNIAEALEMTVDEALSFFESSIALREKLDILQKTGLGYLRLGHTLNHLSGGELQRLKLSRELLNKKDMDKTIYLFDEPTTGLAFGDVMMLLSVFESMISKGASIVSIEHNNLFLRHAQYIIDVGPDAGDKGGEIVNFGTISEMKAKKTGYTWRYL